MEGRRSYRAREARQPASLAGYNEIWCAVPPSCRGAAAPLFYCVPHPSTEFHTVMVRGLPLKEPPLHQATTVGLVRDEIGWLPFWLKRRMATDRLNVGCCHRSFIFIAVRRLTFLRAWERQAFLLIPSVIEAVVGIAKTKGLMFGHNNVATTHILTFWSWGFSNTMLFIRSQDDV